MSLGLAGSEADHLPGYPLSIGEMKPEASSIDAKDYRIALMSGRLVRFRSDGTEYSSSAFIQSASNACRCCYAI